MASPSEKLAQSLEVIKKFQNKEGFAVIKSSDLSRTHKERLLDNGFLQEVIKGWLIAKRPETPKGDTTSWYTSFWFFTSVYLESRFGQEWCLSPEQSLLIHGGNWTVPKQLLIRSPKARNKITELIFNTSFFDVRTTLPKPDDVKNIKNLNVYDIPSSLISCSPDFFKQNPTDARTCLALVKDSSDVLSHLLDGGHSVKAGRLAGAFRNIGNDKIADEIVGTMKRAGYDVREDDPFEEKLLISLSNRTRSPYENRIRLMWQQMRQTVIENFPQEKGLSKNKKAFLDHIEEQYVTDAYHSLSIEGYRVTTELIQKVRSGSWNPDGSKEDKEQRDAMAARGYWQAFQKVKDAIAMILDGNNPGNVVDEFHGIWYQELFAPSVAAGLLKPSDLAGYRNDQVYIKGSMHTPPNKDAVRDAVPTLFDMLKEEKNGVARVVLGHFIFVYIHPYLDGNGRIARFLMNTMLAACGYSWMVIPVESRDKYMAALEEASVNQNIKPFTEFLAGNVKPFEG